MRELILKLFFITTIVGFILSLPGFQIVFPIGGLFLFIAIILFIILIIID